MGKEKRLITSALPYVNNIPHLGNIIGCVLSADVFARFSRSRGYDTLYVCGTDEYGTATEITALKEGTTPKAVCDKYYRIHADVYRWFGISFDIFGRTTNDKHVGITQDIFMKLYKNGYITEKVIDQFYDPDKGIALADRYIRGTCPYCGYENARGDQCEECGRLLSPDQLINPISVVSGKPPVKRKSKHLFLNLPALQKEVKDWIEKTHEKGFWSDNTYSIAKAWLKEGLRERCITRDLKWGVPVPLQGYEDKVFYVWFDAPIGYISITMSFTEDWESWWKDEQVKLYQFMGKDNVPFHTTVFPATLIGTGERWVLAFHINSTEYLTYEGGKFSKSENRGVFGTDAMTSGIPPDVWRYYLLVNRPETSDTDFSWDDFKEKTNKELIGNLGNLVNRVMTFAHRYFNGRVPTPAELNDEDKRFLDGQKELIDRITDSLEHVKLKQGLREIMEYCGRVNQYIQFTAPWRTVKEDPDRCATSVYILMNQVKDLGILIEPYLPFTAEKIFNMLNIDKQGWDDLGRFTLTEGHVIGKQEILFKPLDDRTVEDLKKRFGGKRTTVNDLDLVVGEIISVEKHPDADRLYVEKVNIGDRTITIVSGLVGYYTPEELSGKKVVIVKNLKPAKMRGIVSEGMLLAVVTGEGDKQEVEVLSCEDCAPGDVVRPEGEHVEGKKSKGIITYEQFKQVKLEVKDHVVYGDGRRLTVNGKPIKTEHEKGVVE